MLRICSRRVVTSRRLVVSVVWFIAAMFVASDEIGVEWYFRLVSKVMGKERNHGQRSNNIYSCLS